MAAQIDHASLVCEFPVTEEYVPTRCRGSVVEAHASRYDAHPVHLTQHAEELVRVYALPKLPPAEDV